VEGVVVSCLRGLDVVSPRAAVSSQLSPAQQVKVYPVVRFYEDLM
jgi:hypothetical protein